jgi:hypothetical protein
MRSVLLMIVIEAVGFRDARSGFRPRASSPIRRNLVPVHEIALNNQTKRTPEIRWHFVQIPCRCAEQRTVQEAIRG